MSSSNAYYLSFLINNPCSYKRLFCILQRKKNDRLHMLGTGDNLRQAGFNLPVSRIVPQNG